jgi:uncharacterized protein YhaN
MRFRHLELLRYGGFADRLFDFGAGTPDLHLIVGPNEAGKSTTLHAIGDFLFGIPGQTAQGWRWGYGDLRIRGVVEADGRTVEAVRRKGNKDTLLGPDGAPLAGDPLEPLLAGVGRAAFERMFGLDHQRLREGGEAILRGRDDAARITLEAGTGVAGIGQELDRFTSQAAELFKPSASKPLVNRLLGERTEAQKRVRDASLSDRDWAEEKRRRAEAEEQRAKLLDEAEALTREDARLDRIGRARAPLVRLASARAGLAELGPAPDLPVDAAERLAHARGERRTAGELEAQLRADLDRAALAASGLTVPMPLLALEQRIAALEEARPVIEKAASDLPRRLARREQIDARLAAARRDARLSPDAALPGAAWRRRAATHLAERREAAIAGKAAAARRADLMRTVEELARDLASLRDVGGAPAIEAAVAAMPADAVAQCARAEAEAARRRAQAAEQLRALTPWQGEAAALAGMDLPSPAVVAETVRALETLRDEAVAARRESDAQESEAIRAEARLAAVSAGGELPTVEAVATARRERDALIGDMLAGQAPPAPQLLDAVALADALADARESQAARLAEHASAASARDLARALQAAAQARALSREAERQRLEAEWAALLAPLGFARALPPADWAGWVERRATALAAWREAEEASDAATSLARQVEAAAATLAAALREAGTEPPADAQALVAAAQDHSRRAMEAVLRRQQLEEALDRAQKELAAAERARDAEAGETGARDAALGALLREAGLPEAVGEVGLTDAIAAIEAVAEDVTTRSDIDHQIVTIERDARVFEAEVAEVLQALGRTTSEPATRAVAALTAELRQALATRDRLQAVDADRGRLSREIERAAARRILAEREIDALRARVGAADEAALDRAVAAAAERARLSAAVREAEAELAALQGSEGLDALAAEVAALSPEDEAAARLAVAERREAVASAREEVGRALAAAEEAFGRAARDSAAADAQQLVTETGAALAAAAESHVEAAAAAALLRWALDRHRQVNQAPLIDRAGALFATVTGGAFRGVGVEYDESDRPTIRAIRADGAAVGVEALSEGTRDQLFLALRLGSIEASARSLPIVCDDLLITADDARASEMLRVLAVAARRNQVLLFTHHEHLVAVAREALGPDGFVLHRLAPAALAAA